MELNLQMCKKVILQLMKIFEIKIPWKKKEMYYFCLYQMNKNIIYQEQQWVWNWWFVRKLKLIKL